MNALGAGSGIVVGVLYMSFSREKLAVLLVHSEPVFLLADCVTVGHHVTVATALGIFFGIRISLD